jgi:hypothetical protein
MFTNLLEALFTNARDVCGYPKARACLLRACIAN